MFKELLVYNPKTQKDEWFFNTSIAEQTNVWMNGFQAMLREMTAVNYNFFLDEMIIRRNKAIVHKLFIQGKYPHLGARM